MPLLATRFGLQGALTATGLGFTFWCGSQWWLLARQHQFNWRTTLLRPLLVITVALGIFGLLRHLQMPVIAILAGIATLILASRVSGTLSAKERRLIASSFPRF